MPVDLELAPKVKRAAGERCCEPVVYPDVQRDHAVRMAEVAKALGDPIRLQLVDVLRKHAGKVCVCELVPLFEVSQPTLSHHLKRLRDAGIIDCERQGLWAYYFVIPDSLAGAFNMADVTSNSTGCCTQPRKANAAPATNDVRSQVRERYAAAARSIADNESGAGCCAPSVHLTDAAGDVVFGAALYGAGEATQATGAAVAASLGCGVPTAVAELKPGETVLDLGSGAGADVLISARRVGPSGKAIGLDMTDEMLELARRNAEEAGLDNVEFRRGYIEEIPLANASVDVVISNCVLNLSGDKPKVLREAARVLKPGGRFAISDVVADENMDEATRADMQQWTGCIAGALTRRGFEIALDEAGLVDVEIRETHKVHANASSAIICARKPPSA